MQSEISATSKPDSLLFDHQIQRRTSFQCIHENVIKKGRGNGAGAVGLEATSALRPFASTWDGFVRILHYEGVPALWRGLTPALVMQAPSTVLYYFGYEEMRKSIAPRFGEDSIYTPMLAGSAARTLATTVVSPLELVRTRMQAGAGAEGSLRTVIGELRGMIATTGYGAMWRGLAPTLWRDVPFSAIYWVSYEGIRKSITRSGYSEDLGEFWTSFVTGATAGTFAAICTNPFDVAKTLQQVVHHDEPGCTRKRMNMVGVMQSIVAKDGVKGLYVGLSPRIARVAPACAIMISSYELGKRFFERLNQN
ncbi:hypothetical protein HDU79_006646 [Rhizoclosmatium sp. JEL0117]|nr:hypothetical protein HDU79_006646 [Rhizoclosmatium sp. JEL0117]